MVESGVPSSDATLWRKNPIFGAAGDAVCAELSRAHPARRYDTGALVFGTGDADVALFVLLDGTVRIFHRTPDGRELLVKLLRAPAVFGDIEMLHDLPFLESVDAVEPSLVARVPSRDAMAFLLAHPAAMLEELRNVSAAFCVAARNEAHPFTTLEQRVANLVLSYADLFGASDDEGGDGATGDGALAVSYPLSQRAIAQQLGATERAVAQIVGAWKKQGVMHKQGRRTIIDDVEPLERLAEPIRHGICYSIGMPLRGLSHEDRAAVAEVEVVQGAGSQSGRCYAVHQELLIGRRPPCRLLVADSLTSDMHCRIFRSRTGARFWIEDLDSLNGTRVDGKPIRRKVLKDGARVAVGAIEMVVHIGAAADAGR